MSARPADAPQRIAFVGQATFFEACSMDAPAANLEPRFFEFREGSDAQALHQRLGDYDPDVAVVFRPDVIPHGALHDLRARTFGFLTEPIPRTGDGSPVHEDLERRLWELGRIDPQNFDRVITFDPHVAATAEAHVPVWRAVPLPVADRYYKPVPPPSTHPPKPLFVGRSTPHRERLLTDAKHRYDVLHLAFGVDADALAKALDEHDVGINLHNNPYPSFENRVCLHLAAGHLVLSEWLDPAHGLEAQIDFLLIDTPGDIVQALESLRRFPAIHRSVRLRGRRKAEQFRASRVYPRLVRDLRADLAAFGSPRA